MWVRWRRYQGFHTLRWHKLADDGKRTLCGRAAPKPYDWSELESQPSRRERCVTCTRLEEKYAGQQ